MKKFVFILVLAVLVIAGCKGNKQQGPALTDPFIGGTEGLVASFYPGMPPEQVFDNGRSPFAIGVNIQNLGEADVGPGTRNPFAQVEIVGIDPQQYGNPEVVKNFNQESLVLQGAKKNFDGTVLPGGQSLLTFQGYSYLPDLRGNSQVTLRAELCYDYETFSTTQICVKDNPLGNVYDETICTLTGPKETKNSGAPVHVTNLEEHPMGENTLGITFTVEHVGNGFIYRRDGTRLCDSSIYNQDKDWVYVNVHLDSFSQGEIRCASLGGASAGPIKLYQGQPVPVTCSIRIPPSGRPRKFLELLHIDLGYKYGEFIEMPLQILDVGTVGLPNTP